MRCFLNVVPARVTAPCSYLYQQLAQYCCMFVWKQGFVVQLLRERELAKVGRLRGMDAGSVLLQNWIGVVTPHFVVYGGRHPGYTLCVLVVELRGVAAL